MRYLPLLLLLTGCPLQESGTRLVPEIEIYTDEILPGQDEAFVYARARVHEETDLFVDDAETTVYWTNTLCPTAEPGDTRTAVVYRGNCYAGVTFTCGEIYVADRGTIGASAYIHELGHCFLLWNGRNGDADHSEIWLWELLTDIQNEVRKDEGNDETITVGDFIDDCGVYSHRQSAGESYEHSY